MKKPLYPTVLCESHPPEPGYVVCRHVFGDAAGVAFVDRATVCDMGEIRCAVCYPLSEENQKEFVVCCASCCRAKGWLFDK